MRISIQFQGYCASIVCLVYDKDAVDQTLYMDNNFVKLSRVKTNSYKRILKKVLMRRYFWLINTIFCQFVFVFFWPVFGYEDDYYFSVFFFNEYIKPLFGKYVVNLLRIFFYSSFYSSVMCATMQVNFCLYLFSHMEFQLIIMEDNIRDINDSKTNPRETYQKLINGYLRVCIKHYLIVMQ